MRLADERTPGWRDPWGGLPVLWISVLLLLAGATSTVRAQADPAQEEEEEEEGSGEGIVARFGGVTASFQFFGDVGAAYDSRADSSGSRTSFLAGSFDFFSAVRLNDHLQTLAEVVAEFDDDTNEIGFELERLWGQWSRNDAFYLKAGREHGPVSRWNRRYHHGRIFWPAATQPFLARFEDQGGVLPIHYAGVEVGGTLHTGAGALGYIGVVSNGRGLERTEVTNVRDRNDTKAWDAGFSFSPSGVSGLVLGANYRRDRIPPDPALGPIATETRETISTAFGELRAGRFEASAEFARIEHEGVSFGPRFRHRSWYLQMNCRREGLEPYARVDVRRMDVGDPFFIAADLDLDRWDALAGVRIDLGDQAAFKAEGGRGRAEERDGTGAVGRRGFTLSTLALQWVF